MSLFKAGGGIVWALRSLPIQTSLACHEGLLPAACSIIYWIYTGLMVWVIWVSSDFGIQEEFWTWSSGQGQGADVWRAGDGEGGV